MPPPPWSSHCPLAPPSTWDARIQAVAGTWLRDVAERSAPYSGRAAACASRSAASASRCVALAPRSRSTPAASAVVCAARSSTARPRARPRRVAGRGRAAAVVRRRGCGGGRGSRGGRSGRVVLPCSGRGEHAREALRLCLRGARGLSVVVCGSGRRGVGRHARVGRRAQLRALVVRRGVRV